MAIGRSEDRDNPGNPVVLRHHVHVWDPIRVTHLGQRSSRPHHKGRTDDRNRPDPSQLHRPCEPGAVHIWVPGPALTGRPGMTCEFFSILLVLRHIRMIQSSLDRSCPALCHGCPVEQLGQCRIERRELQCNCKYPLPGLVPGTHVLTAEVTQSPGRRRGPGQARPRGSLVV